MLRRFHSDSIAYLTDGLSYIELIDHREALWRPKSPCAVDDVPEQKASRVGGVQG